MSRWHRGSTDGRATIVSPRHHHHRPHQQCGIHTALHDDDADVIHHRRRRVIIVIASSSSSLSSSSSQSSSCCHVTVIGSTTQCRADDRTITTLTVMQLHYRWKNTEEHTCAPSEHIRSERASWATRITLRTAGHAMGVDGHDGGRCSIQVRRSSCRSFEFHIYSGLLYTVVGWLQ